MNAQCVHLAVSAMLLLLAPIASARLRVPFGDWAVVERSELIVVGRIKPGSIAKVNHEPEDPNNGGSWHHTATLVISETLKGTAEATEIPIILHYGLHPGSMGFMGFGPDAVTIMDTAGAIGIPLSNAEKDNLWFLRRRGGVFGEEPSTGPLGVVDPEDLQVLELTSYFRCYLSPDPEAAVQQYMADHAEVAVRAQDYLDHCELQRIVRTPDLAERGRLLVPYYLGRHFAVEEARGALRMCGAAAGPALLAAFHDSKYALGRTEIISMWGATGYQDCAPTLIALLNDADAFWAKQVFQPGGWSTDTDSEVTRRRREVYGETLYAVATLGKFADPSSREILERTLQRWRTIPIDDTQIVEACEKALRALDTKP